MKRNNNALTNKNLNPHDIRQNEIHLSYPFTHTSGNTLVILPKAKTKNGIFPSLRMNFKQSVGSAVTKKHMGTRTSHPSACRGGSNEGNWKYFMKSIDSGFPIIKAGTSHNFNYGQKLKTT